MAVASRLGVLLRRIGALLRLLGDFARLYAEKYDFSGDFRIFWQKEAARFVPDRDERTALALNRAGSLAAGRDHRGHGKDAETLGYFADRNGWDAILEDARAVSLDLKKKYPGVFNCVTNFW